MPIGLLILNSAGEMIKSNALGIKTLAEIMLDANTELPQEISTVFDELNLGEKIVKAQHEFTRTKNTICLEIIATRYAGTETDEDGYIILLKDFSEIKSLKKELARSKQLALLGELAAGVAHEIRNPLSSIKGFATYFRDKYPTGSDNRKIANIMC